MHVIEVIGVMPINLDMLQIEKIIENGSDHDLK